MRFQRSENGPLLRYSALAATPTATRPALMMGYDRLAQRTSGVIVDGIVDGSIRPVDPTIAALFINGMVNARANSTIGFMASPRMRRSSPSSALVCWGVFTTA